MKKYAKRLLALALVMAMLVTNALPANAATKHNHFNDAHASYVEMLEGANLHLSELSDEIFDAISNYLAKDKEEVKSAFGKYVEGYNTEALKDAIWKAIFIDRQIGLVDFDGLGISKEIAETLTEEVIAEANATGAITFDVEEDNNGEATVMNIAVDPMYAAAYAEIEKATANAEAAPAAEGDVTQQQATMEDAIAAFNEYQAFIDANPDIFGITVPYNSVKDDSNEGGGPITSLVTIANEKMMVDMDGDGTAETETTMLDMFKAGYIPASDLIQIIQMFNMGNQLGAQLLGEEVGATLQACLSAMPRNISDVQKLLFINDWLADVASFDMASIMELEAPTPVEHSMYQTLIYVLTSESVGLPQEQAKQLAPNIIGLWGGTQFGVMSESMGYTGVCMAYTYAYAYIVQNAFSSVYKNANGSWKTRLDVNYIPNPDKGAVAEASVMDNYNGIMVVDGETDPEEHTCIWAEEAKYSWEGTTATQTYACTDEECKEVKTETKEGVAGTTTPSTCLEKGTTEYTATFTDGETATTKVELPLADHTYSETAEYTWEGTKATQSYPCTVEGCTAAKTETVDGAKTETVPSTCKEAGSETYTATFADGETATTKIALALADHTYGENDKCTVCGALKEGHTHTQGEAVWTWAEDYTAKATFTCTVCGEAETVDATVTSVVTPATCTTAGKTVYTATAKTATTTKEVAGEAALGHKFNEETSPDAWKWSDDKSACTAVYNCANGCGETKTYEATVTSTKTEPTCNMAGKTTHVASVTIGENTYTNTEEITISALGHKYENGKCTVCGSREADYIWSPDAPAMVDFVRISYDAAVTMYGEEQDNFESDHYWNAVKVDGQWYYVDPCYTDIYVECMIRDRVETAGNMSHLYFMFSHTSTTALYEGNYKSIDTLYANTATDKTYEKAWFAFARSPITMSNGKGYYFYDSTDMIELTVNNQNMEQEDTEYKLVARTLSGTDSENTFDTLIDFVSGEVKVIQNRQSSMVKNDLIVELTEKHNAFQEEYPSIGISCDVYNNKVYFNLANCILSYDISTGAVTKVMEYNEVIGERDLTEGLGGRAFKVIDSIEEATTTTHNGEDTVITVHNNPIASMTIIDGQMVVSIGTSLGFISGRKSMSDDDTSIGYQFEETNYNPGYVEYTMSDGMVGEDGDNDNDEFMWSANFVDTIDMAHLTGNSHTYAPVQVEATCGENAYFEMRCEDCGLVKEGTRVEVAGTALDHHYREFKETYYTKSGNNWNTGTCYVCTNCKTAKFVDEFSEEGLKVSAHNYVAHVTAWNDDYTEATVDIACEACYGANYDCVREDDTVVLATDVKTTNVKQADRVTILVDEETETRVFYWIYDVTAEYDTDGNGTKETYTGTDWVAREEDKYDNIPFSDVTYKDWFVDAVLWAADNGVTAGYEDGTFRPNASSTRAQVVTFLWNKAGQPKPQTTENPFPDVAENAWYYNAVLWAAENGITAGYEDGTFRPDDICTRAHVVTFLWNSVKQPAPKGTENPFPDVAENAWYYKAVLWAAENGVTAGYEDGTFKPTKNCSRAEIVQLLYNYYE